MITKVIIVILSVVFGFSIIDSAEGFVEFKKYKVTNSEKVCGDKLCSEIHEQQAKKGFSGRDVAVCGDRICNEKMREQKGDFNKSSPHGQFKLGIALDLIQCRDGKDLVIKKTNSLPACVNSESVQNLRDKNWAISELSQQELFEGFIENRKTGIISSQMINDFDVTMNITPEEIKGKRYLLFEGNGWHRLHNVEITISGGKFSESVRSQTDDRGHLYMPWPIPEQLTTQRYNIFATDGIHDFEIEIPISTKNKMISPTIGDDKCTTVTFPIDWSGCDLYGRTMSNVDLRMANLQGANLFGVTINGQDLTGANFSGASLKKGNLDGAILIGANFEHANLVDTKIRNADLSFAKLESAKLYRTDFTDSNLTNANFQDAILSYSILAFTDLSGANLENAGTWAANLNGCVNHPICD